jgi:hypothetical protein
MTTFLVYVLKRLICPLLIRALNDYTAELSAGSMTTERNLLPQGGEDEKSVAPPSGVDQRR